MKDVRYALRGLRRNSGFAMAAVVTLALGIGATTAIFTVVSSVLIRPLPYPESDRLIAVWHSTNLSGGLGGPGGGGLNFSPPMFVTYRDANQTFEQFGVWSGGAASVTGLGDPEQVRTLVVTQGILPALGVPPALGRWFSGDDDKQGTPETIILTYGYWQRRFGGNPTVIGQSIMVDSRPRQVIGVMPQKFRFLAANPEVILPQRFGGNLAATDSNYFYFGIARLKPNVTLAQANADVARMLPIWNANAAKFLQMAPALRPLKQDVVGDVGKLLWVLMGAVGLVLLIACANVANLLLVRAVGRRQELAIRAALGASWARIARELLIESLILGALGGALGLVLAGAGLRLLVDLRPPNLPRLGEISIDLWVLVFLVVVSLLSGLFFGLIPVLKYRAAPVADFMRGTRTSTHSRERHRSQNTLVVLQVAFALVLLVASGLMIRTFRALIAVQPGFSQPDQIQMLRISIPEAEVTEPERVIRIQNDILDRIAAIPGVSSASFATAMPMEEFRNANLVMAEGRTGTGEVRASKSIAPGLFKTQGTPVVAGRDFTWDDIYSRREVAIVSENMARALWQEPSAALGKHLRIGNIGAWREIIGVVGNVYDAGVQEKPPTMVYWRAGVQEGIAAGPRSAPRSATFAIRSSLTGTESLLAKIREAVWAVNPNLPLAQVRTLNTVYERSMAGTSFTLLMLGIAGSIALTLGLIGMYGVMSYVVSQRKREIGIRIALGALQSEIKRRFVGHGLMLAGAGIVLGLLGSMPLTRLMSSLLFGVRPLDPLTLVAVSALMLVAATLATYIPARRTSSVDPVEALKID